MKKLFLYASLFCLGLGSCTKDYVVPEGELPSWLGESIYKELQHSSQLDGTFTTYCRLIDDLGYKEVLSKTGSRPSSLPTMMPLQGFLQAETTSLASAVMTS